MSWLSDLGAFLSPQDQAAMMPETFVNPMVQQSLASLGQLPQRAFQSSESMRMGGGYDPAPMVDAAMLTMGGTGFGAPAGALGAGPTRLRSDVMDLYRARGEGRTLAHGADDSLEALEAERQAGFAAARAARLQQIENEIAAGKIPPGSTMTASEAKMEARLEARRAARQAPVSTQPVANPDGLKRIDSEVMRLFRERGGNDL